MDLTRRTLLGSAAAVSALPLARKARAQTPVVKIGVLNDMSGPYRDLGGMQDVACVRQAIQEFGPKGFNVEVVFADHQNKPDIAAGIARQWFDRDNVDMIIDVPTSSVALAVNSVCAEKNRAYVNVGAGTTELTGKQCTPVTIHFSYDNYMLAKSTGGATVKAGGTSWYFITADYVFGKELQALTSRFVKEAGGKVLGSSVYPFPGTTDFSSYLISAQASGAKVLGLANAGADTVNSIKQAAEFGVKRSMRVAALLIFITDVHGIGLPTAQGLVLTASFYWNLNDRTRAFTNRVKDKMKPFYPNMVNAGNYGGTLHYLKAIAALGPQHAKNGQAVVAQMKAMPVEDDCFGKAQIREDGLLMVPAYLFEVKSPAESKGAWDYYKLLATTPADQAFEPPSPECKLVHQRGI
jgi:branched-chain amino acid transport system substrate-binding protein